MTTHRLLGLVLLPLAALGCVDRPTADEQTDDAKRTYTTATVIQTSRTGDKLAEITMLKFEVEYTLTLDGRQTESSIAPNAMQTLSVE